jgi:hypothetical protein
MMLMHPPVSPERFLSMEEARGSYGTFFPCYSPEHHAGIGFQPPEAVNPGQASVLH